MAAGPPVEQDSGRVLFLRDVYPSAEGLLRLYPRPLLILDMEQRVLSAGPKLPPPFSVEHFPVGGFFGAGLNDRSEKTFRPLGKMRWPGTGLKPCFCGRRGRKLLFSASVHARHGRAAVPLADAA